MKSLAAGTLLAIPATGLAASASVAGSTMKVIEISPEANTGLNSIFVVYNSQGCTLKFRTTNAGAAVYRFSNLGAAYEEEVTDATRETDGISVPLSSTDMGYILKENGVNTYYCWVTNYANHRMTLNGVTASDEQDCSYSILDIDGKAEGITYYTINGQPRTLSREISVTYDTQEFDEDSFDYVTVAAEKTYESLTSATLHVSPPAYCPTYFTLSGDRFLREWGEELTAETGLTEPYAIACTTKAEQDNQSDDDTPSNVMGGDTNGLGGSAPAEITFLAYTTDAVHYNYKWQMAREQGFDSNVIDFNQRDLTYTFMEEGSFYLRFVCSNDAGDCETISDTYTVTIGASALEIPNAFSPNGDGVNDIWKVSYRSLTEFHCEIFNRNGQRIYGFDDPSDGWDGTWNGKTVKPGVYFYVITATGADGKKYKKGGDINIINSINYTPGSSTPEE